MSKESVTFASIKEWCGREPVSGDETLQGLWEETHPDVPFDDEGAELLVRILKKNFTDRKVRLRPVDVLGLTVDGLIDAIPDAVAAKVTPVVAPEVPVVTLSDVSIERIAQRVADLLRDRPAARTLRKRGKA